VAQLDDVRSRLRDQALDRGINPRDVDLLLADTLGKPVTWILAHGETAIDPSPVEALLARRYAGEPLQYIRGKTEFYGREYRVDSRVLIPRPETEVLVDAALERAPRGGRVVDIGSGSGCIAISIERERPDLEVLSVDRSLDALAVARGNAQRLGSRAKFFASDVLSAVNGSFHVIVSNPPYIPLAEYEELAIEVRIHEPRIALTPGESGTEIIERILDEAHAHLHHGGSIILEVGYGQESAMRSAAARHGYTVDAFLPDLAGIPRVVVLSKHGESRELSVLPDRNG
jgi:release factor glutamine methyltransferase